MCGNWELLRSRHNVYYNRERVPHVLQEIFLNKPPEPRGNATVQQITLSESLMEIWVKLGLPKSFLDFDETIDLPKIIARLQQLLGDHVRVLGVIGNSVTVIVNASAQDIITLINQWETALPAPYQPLAELYCRPFPIPPYTLMPNLMKYLQSQEIMHVFKLAPGDHGSLTISKPARAPEISEARLPAARP